MNARIAISLAAVGMAVGLAAPTRANAPAGRYQVSNGAVYDTRTKLTWQQAVQGKYPANITWANAKTYCATLDLAGMVGWRLPTIKELLSIVDQSLSWPSIDPSAFPSTPSSYFSSSSMDSYGSVLLLHFGTGTLGSGGEDNAVFRCVR